MNNLLFFFVSLVAYIDAQVMEEKDNACRTITQIAETTGYEYSN